jgi:hypothetical protein
MLSRPRRDTPNPHRWGVLMDPAHPSDGRISLLEPARKGLKSLQWEDFDHSQTLSLGAAESTSIVFEKMNLGHVALRFCPLSGYSAEKKRLVHIAQKAEQTSFLTTRCIFNYEQKVYVGSELSDMSLADIIDCTIPLQEVHLSAILNQVISALFNILAYTNSLLKVVRSLYHLHLNGMSGMNLIYGSLRASNIFISREGDVKLGKLETFSIPLGSDYFQQHLETK